MGGAVNLSALAGLRSTHCVGLFPVIVKRICWAIAINDENGGKGLFYSLRLTSPPTCNIETNEANKARRLTDRLFGKRKGVNLIELCDLRRHAAVLFTLFQIGRIFSCEYLKLGM